MDRLLVSTEVPYPFLLTCTLRYPPFLAFLVWTLSLAKASFKELQWITSNRNIPPLPPNQHSLILTPKKKKKKWISIICLGQNGRTHLLTLFYILVSLGVALRVFYLLFFVFFILFTLWPCSSSEDAFNLLGNSWFFAMNLNIHVGLPMYQPRFSCQGSLLKA